MGALYTVQAYNTARESENKIHDDSVARRFGFTGGLVPGVDVFGYIAHLPVARWGRAWLERGTAECRFRKPVYDGETATLTETPGTDGGMSIAVESQGVLCATADARLPDAGLPDARLPDARLSDARLSDATSAADAPQHAAPPPPAPEARPPADAQSLAIGRTLSMRPLRPDAAFAADYLRDLRETDPLFAQQDLLHPGLILRLCNWTVSQNVVLGPWIHVGSRIRNLGVAHVGEELTVFARVTNNEEHKGHKFFYLDALVRADGRPVARIDHTAIYEPRQVQEAA